MKAMSLEELTASLNGQQDTPQLSPDEQAEFDHFKMTWEEAIDAHIEKGRVEEDVHQVMLTNGAILNARFVGAHDRTFPSDSEEIRILVEGHLPNGDKLWAPAVLITSNICAIIRSPSHGLPKNVSDRWAGKKDKPAAARFTEREDGTVIDNETGETV